MKDIDLIENPALRNQLITRVDVLDKVKKLALLPDDVHATVDMAATYFEVNLGSIEKVIARHRTELEYDGLKVLSGEDLKEFVTDAMYEANIVSKKSRFLTVIPRRSLLRIGMLLRDSEVAKTVRSYLLNVEEVARTEAVHVVAAAISKTSNENERLSIMRLNAETRAKKVDLERARTMLQLAEMNGISPVAKQSIIARATGIVAGEAIVPLPEVEQSYLSCEEIAEKLGIMSEKGKPHKQAVSALIAFIDINESEKMTVVESKGSWQGTTVKYAASIIPRLSQHLDELGRPEELNLGKVFKLRWEIASRN